MEVTKFCLEPLFAFPRFGGIQRGGEVIHINYDYIYIFTIVIIIIKFFYFYVTF